MRFSEEFSLYFFFFFFLSRARFCIFCTLSSQLLVHLCMPLSPIQCYPLNFFGPCPSHYAVAEWRLPILCLSNYSLLICLRLQPGSMPSHHAHFYHNIFLMSKVDPMGGKKRPNSFAQQNAGTSLPFSVQSHLIADQFFNASWSFMPFCLSPCCSSCLEFPPPPLGICLTPAQFSWSNASVVSSQESFSDLQVKVGTLFLALFLGHV